MRRFDMTMHNGSISRFFHRIYDKSPVEANLHFAQNLANRLFHNVIGAFFNALSINDIPEAAE